MSYCVKCGAKVDGGIMICPQCGAQIPNVSVGRQNDGNHSGYEQGQEYTYGGQIYGGQGTGQEYTYGGQGTGREYGRQESGQEYAYGSQGYDKDGRQGYGQAGQYAYGQNNRQDNWAKGYQPADYFERNEVSQNKVMGVLSYLGILVLIPLIAGNRQSQYVKHHVNQGIVLFILSSMVDLLEGDWVWGLHSVIHFGGGMFSWIFDILGLVFFILMVMGIVSACKGERKELPIIGKIKFFK